MEFTPNAAGARTGSLKIPVTYTGGTTASFTANFTGTGVAEVNSAVLQPGNGSFVDQTVGVQSPYTVLIYLVNQGNLPFKVGTLTGTNAAVGVTTTGEFSAQSAQGGTDGCSGPTVRRIPAPAICTSRLRLRLPAPGRALSTSRSPSPTTPPRPSPQA